MKDVSDFVGSKSFNIFMLGYWFAILIDSLVGRNSIGVVIACTGLVLDLWLLDGKLKVEQRDKKTNQRH